MTSRSDVSRPLRRCLKLTVAASIATIAAAAQGSQGSATRFAIERMQEPGPKGEQLARRIGTRDVVMTRRLASQSVHGYIEADSGDPAWLVPDEELHRHFNDLEGYY